MSGAGVDPSVGDNPSPEPEPGGRGRDTGDGALVGGESEREWELGWGVRKTDSGTDREKN